MAFALVGALAGGGLLAGSGAAWAGDAGRVSAGGAIAGGTAAGDGWRISGVTGYGNAFLGPLNDPTGGPDWVWCINLGLTPPSGSVSVQTVSDGNAAAMAWLLDRLQYDPASLGVADRGLSNAAGSYMAHLVYEEGNKGAVGAEERKAALRAAAWPALQGEADRLWALAQASVTKVTQTEIQTYDTGGQRSGVIGNIGIRNGAGAWVPGVEFTSTLTGNAVFDLNNNDRVDPGETGSYTGTTASSEVQLNWVATPGAGDVQFNTNYLVSQTSLQALRAGTSMQDTVRKGPADPSTVPSAGVRFRAVGSFQPVVSTRVANELVDAGDVVPDAVTFAAAAGEEWIAGAVVRADGVLYGPFASPQPAANTVPAGAPVAGTASVSTDRPGTVTGGADVVVAGSGYYTWVWSIDRDTQVDPGLVTADYTDGFFTVGETSVARLRMDLSSDVPTAAEFLTKGDVPVDELVLSPVTAGEMWLAPAAGDPVDVAMVAEISEPVTEEGLPVGGVLQTIRFTADHFGSYVPGQGGVPAFEALEYSGVYSVRLSVDTPNLTDEARAWLDDAYEDATDGWWAPGETITVRMAPQVVTERQDRVLEERDLPAPLVDDVTLTLPDAGDLWLTSGGAPVEVPVVSDAYGPFDVPRPRTDDPAPADGVLRVGTETVTFTSPGTQATGGATVIHPGGNAASAPDQVTGFYTWESKIPGDVRLFEGFDSDFWVESETASVRDEVVHSSRTIEPDLIPGGRLFDDVRIEQLRPNHGSFQGLPGTGWVADGQKARMVVYGPLPVEPVDGQASVPDGAPVFDTVEFEAVNGSWEFGYDDLVFERVPRQAPTDPVTGQVMTEAWFVFVYEFDGDDRTSPYASRFDDSRERAYVSWGAPPAPPAPAVDGGLVTQAAVFAQESGEPTKVAVAGDSTADVLAPVEVGTVFPAGSSAVSRLYFAPVGTELTCTAEQKVFTSEPLALGEASQYTTDAYTTPRGVAGRYGWVETGYTPDGAVFDTGTCGQASETFDVIGVSTTIGHADTNGDGMAGAGDELWDDIHLTGDLPEGAEVHLTSNVYELTSGQVTWGEAAINTGAGNIDVDPGVCTPGSLSTELTVTQAVTGPGTYATGRFTVPGTGERVIGALTMRETATITTTEETRTVSGGCGAPGESIGPVYFGSGGGGSTGARLARTGAATWGVLLGAGAAIALGAGQVAYARDRRKNRGTAPA